MPTKQMFMFILEIYLDKAWTDERAYLNYFATHQRNYQQIAECFRNYSNWYSREWMIFLILLKFSWIKLMIKI
jgi:hypothetical protein